jgi:hypothetical protein
VVEWFYDALGRTTQKDVWSAATGQWQVYTWGWDAQWKGARDSVSDPAGSVAYTYTPDPVFGGFGWPSATVRTWTDGTTAAFSNLYDADGRVRHTVWPSGATVLSTFHPNGWLDTQIVNGSSVVEHEYDTTYGLPSGWLLTIGADTWEHDIARLDSTKVGLLTWVEQPVDITHTIALSWYANGWLFEKAIDAFEPFSYTYDDLGRIDGIWDGGPGGVPLEEYTYDTIGNPLSMHQQGTPNLDWDYDSADAYNEIPHRERQQGAQTISDDMVYEAVTGRLTSWDTTGFALPANEVFRDYQFDGAGRLDRIDFASGGTGRTTHHSYDVDDEVVYETASSGLVTTTYRFGGWRKEAPTGRVIESLLPMVRSDGGDLRVAYLEPDGHAMWTFDTGAAAADSYEVLGAYGLRLFGYGSPLTPWVMDHLHGAEPDRDDQVVHFGARHMLLRDGMWMQPEPLLHLGITNGNLASPLAYGGLYAAGNSNLFHDRNGEFIGLLVAAAGVVMEGGGTLMDIGGAYQATQAFGANPTVGNFGKAVVAVNMMSVGAVAPGGGYGTGADAAAAGVGGARVGDDAAGALVDASHGTFEIQDGVRRAKATDILTDGQGTVRANVRDSAGNLTETTDIPVGDLLSPHKSTNDVSSSPGAAKRFSSVVEGVREGATPPIEVTPGSTGTPIRDVEFE